MLEAKKQNINNNKITVYTLKNENGSRVEISNLGACLNKFSIKNSENKDVDVVLGYGNMIDYLENPCYMGVTVGRYANRIANGTFTIDDVLYQLDINNGSNNLHSGANGIQFKVWELIKLTATSVELALFCPHLEDGFPGNLHLTIEFELTINNELSIKYNAISDKKTIINLTNHAYFNLNGHDTGLCTQNSVKINANYFTPIAKDGIPTGEILSVIQTPFNFTDFKTIQADIETDNQQLQFGNGYDHNFVVNNYDGNLNLVAEAIGDKSKIKLEVFSTLPGLQFYVGSYLNITELGKNKASYKARSGFCFETQYFPNSPNCDNFPSTQIEANKQYNFTTIYKLSN